MNQELFREIYRRYFPELCRFLSNFSTDNDRIRDIAQNVFIHLLEENPESIRNLRGWLYFCARNALFNDLRNDNNRKRLLSDLALCMPAPQEEEEEELERRIIMVEAAIASLPAKCRDIFILAKRQGMSYRDIAQAKGISVKTVETQMGIALRRIREFCREEKQPDLHQFDEKL